MFGKSMGDRTLRFFTNPLAYPAIEQKKIRCQRYVDRLLAGEIPPPIKMDGDVIVDGNQ